MLGRSAAAACCSRAARAQDDSCCASATSARAAVPVGRFRACMPALAFALAFESVLALICSFPLVRRAMLETLYSSQNTVVSLQAARDSRRRLQRKDNHARLSDAVCSSCRVAARLRRSVAAQRARKTCSSVQDDARAARGRRRGGDAAGRHRWCAHSARTAGSACISLTMLRTCIARARAARRRPQCCRAARPTACRVRRRCALGALRRRGGAGGLPAHRWHLAAFARVRRAHKRRRRCACMLRRHWPASASHC